MASRVAAERDRGRVPDGGLWAHGARQEPAPPVDITEEDYTLLVEVLDRAALILQSSPSPDRSLSFLRILAAYDQILLRHDIAPSHDTRVFQWLVTLNIATEEEARAQMQRDAQTGASHAGAQVKEYDTWRRKLDQLYAAGEGRRQAQRQEQRLQQHKLGRGAVVPLPPQPAAPPAPLHDRELSIDSLSSSAASFQQTEEPSPHVSFAARRKGVNAGPMRLNGGRSLVKPQPPAPEQRQSRSRSGERRRAHQTVVDDLLAPSSPDERQAPPSTAEPAPLSDAEARDEQVFLDLLRSGSLKHLATSGPGRQRLVMCFNAWRAHCRPRYELLPRMHAARRARTANVARHILHVWRSGMEAARFLQSLEQRRLGFERRHGGSAQQQLFRFWLQEASKRRRFKSKQRITHLSVAMRTWQQWLDRRADNRHLQQVARQRDCIFQARWGVRRWRLHCQRQRRVGRRVAQMHDARCDSLVMQWWREWRERFLATRQYVSACQRHLLLLRQQQRVLHWASATRLLHSPAHQSILTVQQFHLLWRWLQCSFGSGYELMRIIWLSKIKYQQAATAQPSVHEQELQRQRQRRAEREGTYAGAVPLMPTPATHPFVSGPPVHSSFAATATAPFAQSQGAPADFFFTMPSSSLHPSSAYAAPSASLHASMASSGPPVLGVPVSSLDVAAPPHVDSSLPMQHAILTLLNRAMLFRRHKLPHLLSMIQLWARWYLRHLFVHWRANIALKKQQREAQRLASQLVAAEQLEQEQQAVQVHSRGLMQRALDRWQDSFHKAAYYSLLLKHLYAHQARRLLREHYVLWKFDFVATRARSLFRVRRGIRGWTRFLAQRRAEKRKMAIVHFKRQRGLQALVWSAWRLTLQRELDTRRAMLAMLWQRWKSNYMLMAARAHEERDAATYHALKLLLRTLLTWRALSLSAAVEHKYTQRAVHQHHSQLAHRHIVQWVNWKRYRGDTRRMMMHADARRRQELTLAATTLWRANAHARRSRHQQFRDCLVFVRNKHLAYSVLHRWHYALSVLQRCRLIAARVSRDAQLRAWLLWLQCMRAKNDRYAHLEVDVALRRDWNILGRQFHSWLQCSRDMAKARRLREHCDTVWYYALVQRLFRAWKHVSGEVHQQQMAQAREFHAQQGESWRALSCLRQWRGILQHRARYAQLVRETHVRLMRRHHLQGWFRTWHTLFRRQRASNTFRRTHHSRTLLSSYWSAWRQLQGTVRHDQQRITQVQRLITSHTLQRTFARWAGPFVAFQRARRQRLGAAVERQRLAALRGGMVAWRSFRNYALQHSQASDFAHHVQLSSAYRAWRSLFVQQRRVSQLQETAERIDTHRSLQRVYAGWKAGCRAAVIHRLFLRQKTFLSWQRYTRRQKEHARIAAQFKANFHTRRMQFMFAVWRRFVVTFCRKQRRRLSDRHRKAAARSMHDSLALWFHWAHARTQARQRMQLVVANAAVQCQALWFSHWSTLYQQLLWTRSLHAFATRTHRRNATVSALQRWHGYATIVARLRAQQQQVRATVTGHLLARVWGGWMRARAQQLASERAVARRFEQPRAVRILRRWRCATGRRSRILRLHQPYLHRTLVTWLEIARESQRARVLEPRADVHYRRTLAAVVLHHWRRVRQLHAAVIAVRPRAQQRLCSTVLRHWQAMLQLRRSAEELIEKLRVRRSRRSRAAAIGVWRGHVQQRRALTQHAASVRVVSAYYLAARCYNLWRRRLRMLRTIRERSAAFFLARPCMRMKQSVFAHWRAHLRFLRIGRTLEARGAEYALERTLPQQQHARLRQWRGVAHYSARVRLSCGTLVERRTYRITLRLFRAWLLCSRRLVSVQRIQQLRFRVAGSDAWSRWRSMVATSKAYEQAVRARGRYAQRAFWAHWLFRLHGAQENRAQVALVRARMLLASQHAQGRWLRVQPQLLLALQRWMSPASSVRRCLLLLRAYNRHCKTFRDAHDAAASFYDRRVLTPAAWREWIRACAVSRHQRRVRTFVLRHAYRRLRANILDTKQRKAMHRQQGLQAEQRRQQHCFLKAWQHWKRETQAVITQRAAATHATYVHCFGVWMDAVEFSKLTQQREAAADHFRTQRLMRSPFAHWRQLWLHTANLLSAAISFSDRLSAWHRGRVFGAWLTRVRVHRWRRQRTVLILQAVRSLWQKNAFMAWQHYVLAVRSKRREVILARVLFRWKLMAKQEKQRRKEARADRESMQQLERERGRLRPAQSLFLAPPPPPAASSIGYAFLSDSALPALGAASSSPPPSPPTSSLESDDAGSRMRRSVRGAALTPADLEDGERGGAQGTENRPVASAFGATAASAPFISRLSFSAAPRSTLLQSLSALGAESSQWRLTPFREADHMGDARSLSASTFAARSGLAAHLPPRSLSPNSMRSFAHSVRGQADAGSRARAHSPPSRAVGADATSPARLSASVSVSSPASDRAHQRSAAAAAFSASVGPQLLPQAPAAGWPWPAPATQQRARSGLSSSTSANMQKAADTSGLSRSQLRQEQRQQEHARLARQKMHSPATAAFVRKLFAD